MEASAILRETAEIGKLKLPKVYSSSGGEVGMVGMRLGGIDLSLKTAITASAWPTDLNGVCPYYTMFPLTFPLGILKQHAKRDQLVLDPYCGRGTTNFAARLLGIPSAGVDSSPVAVALSQAKLASASPSQVVRAAKRVLEEVPDPLEVPEGEFWKWAYEPQTFQVLCRLREGLLASCQSSARILLRAIILGALHGPLTKSLPSYFSNQCPRTYAPKPAYATRFWKTQGMSPPKVDVLQVIERRAKRYLSQRLPDVRGLVLCGDSRSLDVLRLIKRQLCPHSHGFTWVITSPPYYGMRTYIPDQWIRFWFLGGPSHVAYSYENQMQHSGPEEFIEQLAHIWQNVGAVCASGARLVVRFGGINDRKQEPLTLLKESLKGTGWVPMTVRPAGNASRGKRQADHFARVKTYPIDEHDLYARWTK